LDADTTALFGQPLPKAFRGAGIIFGLLIFDLPIFDLLIFVAMPPAAQLAPPRPSRVQPTRTGRREVYTDEDFGVVPKGKRPVQMVYFDTSVSPPAPLSKCCVAGRGRRELAGPPAAALQHAGATPRSFTFGAACCGAGFWDSDTGNIFRVGGVYFALVTEVAPEAPAKGARKKRDDATYFTVITLRSLTVPRGYVRSSSRACVEYWVNSIMIEAYGMD
jgi:hypothetical protein